MVRQGLQIREHRIGMRHEHDHLIGFARHFTDHIERLIDVHLLRRSTIPQQPVPAEFRPLFLMVGRRRNPAQLHDQLLEFRQSFLDIGLQLFHLQTSPLYPLSGSRYNFPLSLYHILQELRSRISFLLPK